MWVFELDLIDHIDTKVQVHGLIAQDVLELFCYAHHLITAAHREDLGKATVEENTLSDGIEPNQIAQQSLIRFCGAGVEVGVTQLVRMAEAPGRFFGDRRYFTVHVENFGLIHSQ